MALTLARVQSDFEFPVGYFRGPIRWGSITLETSRTGYSEQRSGGMTAWGVVPVPRLTTLATVAVSP